MLVWSDRHRSPSLLSAAHSSYHSLLQSSSSSCCMIGALNNYWPWKLPRSRRSQEQPFYFQLPHRSETRTDMRCSRGSRSKSQSISELVAVAGRPRRANCRHNSRASCARSASVAEPFRTRVARPEPTGESVRQAQITLGPKPLSRSVFNPDAQSVIQAVLLQFQGRGYTVRLFLAPSSSRAVRVAHSTEL